MIIKIKNNLKCNKYYYMIEYTKYASSYSNAEAERGKFVVIDTDYLQTTYAYPSGGRGRYAMLTKEVDPINFQDTAVDAFGRLRVSEPETLFGSKLLKGKYPDLWNEQITGSSTSIHLSSDAMVSMTVAASGDSVIRQTKQRFIYQPGKSLISLTTFVSAQIQPNVYKRVGQFLNNPLSGSNNILDGIYFESNGVTNSYNFCIGKAYGLNAGTNSVPQSAWNIDKMDGSGLSRISLDFSKNQILFIDYEWLGVGRVRTGFIVDGNYYTAHEFKHTNITQGVYMVSPNLPVRYEISSVNGSGQFGVICSSVISEGGYQPTGSIRSLSSSTSGISLNGLSVGNIMPLLSIRLKELNYGTSAQLLNFNIATDGSLSNVYEVMMIKNGTVTTDNNSWIEPVDSSIEYKVNAAANRITSNTGLVINSFLYTNTNQSVSVQQNIIESLIPLGVNIDGTRDRIDIAIRRLNGNADNKTIFFSVTVRENI